jgi:hypothetical protein
MPIAQLVIASANIVPNYAVNVLHYNVTLDGSITDLKNMEEFIDAWRTANEGAFINLLPTDTELKNYSAKVVSAGGGPTSMLAVAVPGASGSVGMVAGVAADIALCPNGAPWRWGHIYTPGVAIVDINEGTWEAGFLANVAALKAQLLTNVTWGSGGTAELVIYNKKLATFALVVDAILRPKPTLLNKRLRPVV